MRIGQLAAAAGVSVQTVRLYERRGLLAAPARRGSGYREYSAAAVDEIRAALGSHSDDGELCRLAAEKARALEAEIDRLTRTLDALEQRRRACGCDRRPRFQTIEVRRP